MKKIVAGLAMMAGLAAGARADMLAAWDFYGSVNTTSVSNFNATAMHTSVVQVTLNRSGGLAGGVSGSNWIAVSYSPAGSFSTAVTSNDCFQFTVAASNGYLVLVTNVTMRLRSASATSPTSTVLRASVASDFATYTDSAQNNAAATAGIYTYSAGVTGFTATNTLYFRIYQFGANVDTTARQGGFAGGNTTTPSANAGLFGGNDDVVVQGTVTEAAPPPPPATQGTIFITQ